MGPSKGLKSKVYEAGYHLVLPYAQELLFFPRHMHVLEMTNNQFYDTGKILNTLPAVHVQTSDGFYVTVEASVLYHIKDPYKVALTVGAGNTYLSSVVFPKCEPALKQAMGELTTEDFLITVINVWKRLKKP